MFNAIIFILDMPINIRSTVVKNGVCQSRQCVHRSWIFGLFDSTVIRFDLEQNHFDINLGKFA